MTKVPLKVEVEKIDTFAVVRLASNFFTSSTMAKQLKQAIETLFESECYLIVVNLRDVTSIDSEALGILTYGYKKCLQHDGNLVLCDVKNTDVAEVLDIVNLSKIIKIYDSEVQAIEDVC